MVKPFIEDTLENIFEIQIVVIVMAYLGYMQGRNPDAGCARTPHLTVKVAAFHYNSILFLLLSIFIVKATNNNLSGSLLRIGLTAGFVFYTVGLVFLMRGLIKLVQMRFACSYGSGIFATCIATSLSINSLWPVIMFITALHYSFIHEH